ncbi:LTA synthase family protein [Planctomycetota bacterium]
MRSMKVDIEKSGSGWRGGVHWFLCDVLGVRAYSLIMFGALFCVLVVKLFHAHRMSFLSRYFEWIAADVAFLLLIEIVMALIIFRWRRRWVFRTVTIVAALFCTWSVINAAWITRTGTQILPRVLLPLYRDPISSFGMIGVNLAKMPLAAVNLLLPSAIALIFFFWVLSKAPRIRYHRQRFAARLVFCFAIIIAAIIYRGTVKHSYSAQIASVGLRYNCHLKALISFVVSDPGRLTKADIDNATREVPAFDQLEVSFLEPAKRRNHNVIIVVLEGVQYRHTSLGSNDSDLTPYLVRLAGQGVEFTNMRTSLTHTTKALFSLHTGRYASASQDLVEAIPVEKPYASLATILKEQLGFRTAFFQSAKGSFEARPALVHNLGFEKFWSRDSLADSNSFVGYLGSDEFAMLEPITKWISSGDKPFLLTILCSVTHDPYEVPQWYGEHATEPVQRYRQAITYTDQFIAALDAELSLLDIADDTILCVVGDHGEAFGEHGQFGHERIAFDEAMHIPWIIRAGDWVEAGTKMTGAVNSTDLVPTLLAMFGFNVNTVNFDGVDALGDTGPGREVFFSGWMCEGSAGFVKDDLKFIYNPTNKIMSLYDLSSDPFELVRQEITEQQQTEVADRIIRWRKRTIFRPKQQKSGKKTLYDCWLCRWTNRVCSAKYLKK